MVSVPSESSSQVRLLPSPSAPQVPLATMPVSANAAVGRRVNSIASARRALRKRSFFVFIKFLAFFLLCVNRPGKRPFYSL